MRIRTSKTVVSALPILLGTLGVLLVASTPGEAQIPPDVVNYLDLKCYRLTNVDGFPLDPINFQLHLDHLNPVLQQIPLLPEDVVLLDPFQLCVPVAKNGTTPPQPALDYIQWIDLECFHIQADPHPLLQPLVLSHLNPVLQPQLSDELVVMQEPQKVCVPVAKSLPDGTAVNPPPSIRQSIQFIDQKGYGILDSSGNTLPPAGFSVHLDHLNPVFQRLGLAPEDVVMDVPQQLTVPVAKNNRFPPAADLPVISQIDEKCYALVDAAGQTLPPLNVPQRLWQLNPVLVDVQSQNVIVQEPQQLCVPVQKSIPGTGPSNKAARVALVRRRIAGR